MTIRLWIASIALSVAITAGPALALELGDPAPALNIAEWIQGSPVDLKAGKGKHVYVLEFWATWCMPCRASMPHLTALQKKFKDKGLIVVGISDENPRTLKSFVTQMGSKMDFTVGADKRMSTMSAYMGGVHQNGIPYSFVIDKSGRLAWHGAPFQNLDQVVELVIAGKYDLDTAMQANHAKKMLMQYFQTAVDADHSNKPKKKQELAAKANKLGKELFKFAQKNPTILDLLAWNILVLPQLKTRDFELAVKSSKAACELTKGENASFLDTYARALWNTGHKAEAIKQQARAVELAKEPLVRKQFQDNLDKYKKEAPTPTTSQAAGK